MIGRTPALSSQGLAELRCFGLNAPDRDRPVVGVERLRTCLGRHLHRVARGIEHAALLLEGCQGLAPSPVGDDPLQFATKSEQGPVVPPALVIGEVGRLSACRERGSHATGITLRP
jgi:hypothetical protein